MVPVALRILLPALLLLAAPVLPGPERAQAPGAPLGAPSVPVRYGLLWLQVEPAGAHVALDGEFLDRGVWLISMAPGLHDVAVRLDGFQPWARRIGIGPGENLKLAVQLEKDAAD